MLLKTNVARCLLRMSVLLCTARSERHNPCERGEQIGVGVARLRVGEGVAGPQRGRRGDGEEEEEGEGGAQE